MGDPQLLVMSSSVGEKQNTDAPLGSTSISSSSSSSSSAVSWPGEVNGSSAEASNDAAKKSSTNTTVQGGRRAGDSASTQQSLNLPEDVLAEVESLRRKRDAVEAGKCVLHMHARIEC